MLRDLLDTLRPMTGAKRHLYEHLERRRASALKVMMEGTKKTDG